MMDTINAFEEPMARLPWGHGRKIAEHLIERGEEICKKYPPESLIDKHPNQFIRAVKRG